MSPARTRGLCVIASAAKQSSRARRQARKINAEIAAAAAFFSWRASRALDCRVASLLAMTQRRFASALCSMFNCQTARSRMFGLRRTCIIAPVLCPAWGSRSSCALGVYAIRAKSILPCPQGACGTTGRFTAPAAPARVCMRASRMPSVAHGQWPSPTPKIVELNRASEADHRLRSAREWTLRLAACPRGCHWRRRAPVRASCRPDMHLDRPPVVPASVPVRLEDQRSSTRSRVRHRSGHPHPAPRFEDDRDAPLIGAGRGITIIILGGKCENECGTI